MICPNCQSINKASNLYCTHCGIKLPTQSALDEQTELLKAESRALAAGQAKRSELDQILKDVGEPMVKRYPALSFMSAVLVVIGFLMAGLGLFGFGIGLSSFTESDDRALSQMQSDVPLDDPTTRPSYVMRDLGRTTVVMFSVSALYLGVLSIAIGELLALFVDLQRNADRQSILLTMLLRRTVQEHRP